MSDINLKPCPFCGGKATLIIDERTKEQRPHGYRFTAFIKCRSCNISFSTDAFYASREEAGAAAARYEWNRRVEG